MLILDAVTPLERVTLSAGLSKALKELESANPLRKVQLSAEIAEILAKLGADGEELSDDPTSPNYRYKDTGYIADSRKERAASLIYAARDRGQAVNPTDIDWDTVESNPRAARDLINKANLFGKTDWDAMKEAGVEPGAAFLINKVFASIGPEPEDNPQARKDYAFGLQAIRDRFAGQKAVAEVLAVIDDIRDEMTGVQLSPSQTERIAALRAEYREKRGIASAAKDVVDGLYEVYSKKHSALKIKEYEQEKRARKKWKPDPDLDAEIAALKPDVDAAFAAWGEYRDAHPELTSKTRELGNGWTSYSNDLEWAAQLVGAQIEAITKEAQAYNVVRNPVTRAWLTFGERFFKLLHYRSSVKGSDSFAGHVTNAKVGRITDWSWAEANARQPRAATAEEVSFQMKVTDTFERVGGKPITVESTSDLKSQFGFRDVQSGNWVLKDPNSAKFHVEQTAGAMSDMADILGIPADALGLGGRFAIAFGARGSGGKNAARAHYEPIQRVMNMTKMGGGGFLGHEYGHGLDNMVAELVTQQPGRKDTYASETPDILPAGPIRDAFAHLKAVMTTGTHRLHRTYKFDEKDRRTAKYNFDSPTGRTATAVKDAGNATEAILRIKDIFGDTSRSPRMAKQMERWCKLAAAYYAPIDVTSLSVRVGALTSSFMYEATLLDKGDDGKYWSTVREMMARAFQAYLEDSLTAAGRRNDYLSALADNKYHKDPLFGIEWKPFPEGEERQKLNAAFDRLFAALREAKTFENAAKNKPLLDAIFGSDDESETSEFGAHTHS